MNVVIKINELEAIPVRALPLLAEWGAMNPQKLAGALGRVTDDERRPLFDNLHDMNAFYVEDGAVHPVEEHQWREHTYRQLEALSDQIKHTEISHATGYVDWRVKALEILPEYAFVWKEEYAPIYDREYGPQAWANLPDATREARKAQGKKAPPALKFSPPIAHERMKTLVQAALDAIGRATGTASKTINDVAVNTPEHHSSNENAIQQVEELPLAKKRENATPAPVVAASDAPAIPKNQRPDLLAPLIEKAQRGESDPFNAAVIWLKLCDMAEQKLKPFIGKTGDGLQWIDAFDDPQFMSKKALSDRLRRAKKPR